MDCPENKPAYSAKHVAQPLFHRRFFLQNQKGILLLILTQIFRKGFVYLNLDKGRISAENVLSILNFVRHIGKDLRFVIFLVRRAADLFRHTFFYILFPVAAHIAKMPAAVLHADATGLSFRETQLAQLELLLL